MVLKVQSSVLLRRFDVNWSRISHRRLGDLLYGQKQYDGAVREYAAVVASHPIDKAGAEFHLAQAYLAAGQKDKAQESVLAALEAAPGYRPAQKMLLELNQLQK